MHSARSDTARQTTNTCVADCKIINKYTFWSHITYHHIVDLIHGRNRLKVGKDKPKLKVKMESVSDDDNGKDFLKSHILSSRRKGYSDCYTYIFRRDVPGLWASDREGTAADG